MNKKLFLLLGLIPLALSLVTTSVNAKAEIWFHDIYKDVGRDAVTSEPIPGVLRMVSEVTWNNHMMWNDVFDASGNLHVNYKYLSTGTVNGEALQWNGAEWVSIMKWSQKLNTIGGRNELTINFFTETQTARQIDIHNENFQAVVLDPSTGEVISTFEYTVIAHLLMKWLDGELQFDLSWTINRP